MLLLSLLAIHTMTESVRRYYAFLRSVQEHTCVYVTIKSACHADNSTFHIKLKKKKKKERAFFNDTIVAIKRMKMKMKKFACCANANSLHLILLNQIRTVCVSCS